ncbi:uncharacterized protein LOC144883340 [Branchiostoma floridae x Branchiostoma japonicum]
MWTIGFCLLVNLILNEIPNKWKGPYSLFKPYYGILHFYQASLLFDSVSVLPHKMAERFSDSERAAIQTVFDKFDKDGGGSIDREELGDMLRELGESPTEDVVTAMMMSLDKDKSGTIDFDEFLSMVKQVKTVPRQDTLLAVFQQYDKDGSGKLDASEIKEAMKKGGCKMTDKAVNYLIKRADKDGDGLINYQEFASIMKPQK